MWACAAALRGQRLTEQGGDALSCVTRRPGRRSSCRDFEGPATCMILEPTPPPKPTMSAAHNASTKDRVLIACIGDEVRSIAEWETPRTDELASSG
jgi:hypothetical protein